VPAAARPLNESSFLLVANGASGTPPASDLLEHLLSHDVRRVTTVFHPLGAGEGTTHELKTYQAGQGPRERSVRLPSRPPYTYPLDLLVPPRAPRVDGWFAFNNLVCARALWERGVGRAGKVAYWAIDFVPNRFGAGSALTRAYDVLDSYCCRRADLRIEMSAAALQGRDARHGLASDAGPERMIAPIGIWLNRVPRAPEDGWSSRRLIFAGHLVERMGCDTVIETIGLLAERGVGVSADITGRGPLDQQLRAAVLSRGLSDRVRFHGYLPDHREVERLLSQASIALAPYNTRVESFTRYADPAKLKSYLAAGLPILLTDVPPNAEELVRQAGAEVVADDPAAFADAVERLLTNPDSWRDRRVAALDYARKFDWTAIFDGVLGALGFTRQDQTD
jgi:glycosyltransferase involved in cell wall biosynthesis